MTNEKKNDILDSEIDEAIVDCSEETLEALRQAVAELEEKEALLTEKLAKARAAGLMYQSARCRALLQKIVMLKKAKQDELKVVEAQALAEELDLFANEMENELDPEFVAQDEEAVEQISALRMKAKKGKLISNVLTAIALVACLAGALVYLILSLPEVMNIPFNWIYLAADGALMVLLLVIAAIIRSSASTADRAADEVEAERQQAIDEYNEQLRAEMMSLASLEAVSAAYDIEGIGALEDEAEAAADEAASEKKLNAKYAALLAKVRAKIPEEKLNKIDQVSAKVKDNAKVIIPVASVCIAALAMTKYSASKRHAENRSKFYEWLG